MNSITTKNETSSIIKLDTQGGIPRQQPDTGGENIELTDGSVKVFIDAKLR